MQPEPVEPADPNYELSAVTGDKWDECIDQNAALSFISTDIQESNKYGIDIDENKVWLYKIKHLVCF
jgi:hypothetical protein